MPDNNGHIDDKTLALIRVTAQEVVDKTMEEFEKKMNTAIELHGLKCEAKKLSAFKAAAFSVIGGAAVFVVNLVTDWIRQGGE
jgi:hypothetical protein